MKHQQRFKKSILGAIFMALGLLEVKAQEVDENTAPQQALALMLDLQYADEQQCFVIDGDKVLPVMPLLVSVDGLDAVAHEKVVQALEATLARGCDIHQADLMGLTPLNTAILHKNLALMDYLLDQGANPWLEIDSPKETLNGLNSLQFLDLLIARAPNQAESWQKMRIKIAGL